jgi:hypothetical protein
MSQQSPWLPPKKSRLKTNGLTPIQLKRARDFISELKRGGPAPEPLVTVVSPHHQVAQNELPHGMDFEDAPSSCKKKSLSSSPTAATFLKSSALKAPSKLEVNSVSSSGPLHDSMLPECFSANSKFDLDPRDIRAVEFELESYTASKQHRDPCSNDSASQEQKSKICYTNRGTERGASTNDPDARATRSSGAQPSNAPPRQASNGLTAGASNGPTSHLVVIFDNIVGVPRKGLEPELYRIAPWLHPVAVDVMRSGGLRVKCKTPADADRLLKRDGFPENAFNGPFTVHRPGSYDKSRPVSPRLDSELRSVITSRLPSHYDVDDLRKFLLPEYVESIREIPPKDPNRPPLRVIVMKTNEQRDEALLNGLQFLNRRISVRPLRPPVLPAFCRRCSKPGHPTVDCTSPHFTCAKCAGRHSTLTCNVQRQDFICPNCTTDESGPVPHSATYRGCPAFRTAAAKEAERRSARVAAKLAREDRFRNPHRNAPRSNNLAPVRTGVSFANAASHRAPPVNSAATTSPPLAAAAAPPEESTLELLRSIKKDSEATRAQLAALQYKVAELSSVVASLQEQIDTVPEYDIDDVDYHMDDAQQAVAPHSACAAPPQPNQESQHESI